MRRILKRRSPVLVVLLLILFPRIAISQQSGNQKQLRCRAGHFATPIEIPGDIYKRKITSIEVDVDIRDEKGEGLLIVDDRPMKFNEFGDATATHSAGIQEHKVSLVVIPPKKKALDPRASNSPVTRKIYKLVFDEPFCDREFFLNVPNDRLNPVRLVVCKDGESETETGVGPFVESMHRMTKLGTPIEFLEDEPTPDEASYSTKMIKIEGRWYPGFEIRTKLAGSGSILLDQNHAGVNDYGDGGIQTLMGYMTTPTGFISTELVDPFKLGRRVFDLKIDRSRVPKFGGTWETADVKYSMVIAAKSSGQHRLIIKRDGKIVQVIPLNADDWRRHVAQLAMIKNERSANAVRKLRRLCGNNSYLSVGNGDVAFLRLGTEFSDEALSVAGELGELSEIALNHGGPEFTGSGLETIGKLKKLESISLRGVKCDDRFLKIVGSLPNLRVLTIEHGFVQAQENLISDEGIAHLANCLKLKRLILTGNQISNKCLSSLKDHSQLKVLEFHVTAVSLAGVVPLRLKHPDCQFRIVNYQQGSVFVSSDRPLFRAPGDSYVDLSGTLTQTDYESLAQLKTIRKITLPKTATLGNLNAILKMESLRSISFGGNENVDNGFVQKISELPDLRELRLAGCRNIDKGCIEYLASMTKLKELSITYPAFDSNDVRRLRETLPNCKINYY